MSPIHHSDQMAPYFDQSAKPPKARQVTPIVALTMVLIVPARIANRTMFSSRSKTSPPRAKRLTRYAPTAPSRVLPVAMPREVAALPAVVRFTMNAARRIAGQTRYPMTRNAASAMPAGGHTTVALGLTFASLSPSLPPTTYAAATATTAARVLNDRD